MILISQKDRPSMPSANPRETTGERVARDCPSCHASFPPNLLSAVIPVAAASAGTEEPSPGLSAEIEMNLDGLLGVLFDQVESGARVPGRIGLGDHARRGKASAGDPVNDVGEEPAVKPRAHQHE